MKAEVLLLLTLSHGFAPPRALLPPRRASALASWPELKEVALPVKLAGGIFLFRKSVAAGDRALADEVLSLAQRALNDDAVITAELGYGLETGGVYSSAADGSADGEGRRLALQFQITGGMLWAQGTVRAIKRANQPAELVGLTVSNMDAAMTGEVSCAVRLPDVPPDVSAAPADDTEGGAA